MRNDSSESTASLYFAKVFVYRDGATSGPYSLYNLQQELRLVGRFESSDVAWLEGATKAQPLCEVVVISSRLRLRVMRWVLAPVFLGVGGVVASIGFVMLGAYRNGELRADSGDAILTVIMLFAIAGAFLIGSLMIFLGSTWPMESLDGALRREASDSD